MKSNNIGLLGLLLLATFSCTKETGTGINTKVYIHATHQSFPDVKTNIGGPDNFTVTWNATDKLAVFDGTEENYYCGFSLFDGANTKSATFFGTIRNWESGSKTFYAAYPFNFANIGPSPRAEPAEVPQIQTQDFSSGTSMYAHLGLFDYMAATPVTVEKVGEIQPDINFSFQHIMAILDIEIANNTGKAVTITQIKIKRVGPDFTLLANLDLFVVPWTAGFYTKVSMIDMVGLLITNSTQTNVGGVFTGSMIMAPADLTSGNTDFEVYASDGSIYSVKKTSGINIVGGKRYKVQLSLEYPVVFVDSRDGILYTTVKIGNQIWLAENMKYLPVVDNTTSAGQDNKYYVYNYDGTSVATAKANSNYATYGTLYNYWSAISACPSGWHLPSDAEWKMLEVNLEMNQSEADQTGWRYSGEVGNKIKSTNGWVGGAGNNSSGFNAIPGGYRADNGFYGSGTFGRFWTSTKNVGENPIYRGLISNDAAVFRGDYFSYTGFSVRCILN